MFATSRVQVECLIVFVKIIGILRENNKCFSGYSNKCLYLASEKFVLACESNLSLATGLAS